MIVLDCSAAIDMVLGTGDGEALRSLILSEEKVVSSELFPIESASALRKYVKAGIAQRSQMTSYLQGAVALVDSFVPIHENYVEAFHESLRLEASPYDMLYFTLARRNSATLVTLDTRLMAICEQEGVDYIQLVTV